MARSRSSEKRTAVLDAAVYEIAEVGLGAPTARIAKRAGVAAGTLFTYFASKEELLNELYLELKAEVYERINSDFPHKGSLESRARHIWSSCLGWGIAFPERRKVSLLLNLSDQITAETRRKAGADRSTIETALRELGRRESLRGMPEGFATATMVAMQEATMEFITKYPKQSQKLIEKGFQVLWRALR